MEKKRGYNINFRFSPSVLKKAVDTFVLISNTLATRRLMSEDIRERPKSPASRYNDGVALT